MKDRLGVLFVIFHFLYFAQIYPFIHFHPVNGEGGFRIEVHLHLMDYHDDDHADHHDDHFHGGKDHLITAGALRKLELSKTLSSSLNFFVASSVITPEISAHGSASPEVFPSLILLQLVTSLNLTRNPPCLC